ncbi:uncharacterized protein LOC121867540 isoform X2 [Homarus americanus]|uniref:uncharacterized protein LOC121867540 isoform X2 n=1 Tax=Homarus americanus TaxID=6706 RepID=UPI001C43C28E|nr:uncharacterized protein LOC121867540 isoform X2 [Homarus americanus]
MDTCNMITKKIGTLLAPFILTVMMPTNLPSSRMPRGFTQEDLEFGKLLKGISKIGQNVMIDIVRTMYSHPTVKSERGTMHFRVYLKTVLSWSSGKVKSKFTKLDEPFLDENLMTQEFDISFGFRVITEVLFDVYPLSCNCKDQIKYLKTLRNKVSHKYNDPDLNFETEIDQLKTSLREIYEGVGEVLKVDFTKNIASMERFLHDICDSHFRQDDMISYEEDIREFKESNEHKLTVIGCKEFKEQYCKCKVLNPWTCLTEPNASVYKRDIGGIFTPLTIKDSNTEIDLKELLTVKKRINGKLKVPNALLLLGPAGCGKTSICHYILNDWYGKGEKIAELKNIHLVILVEMHRVRSMDLQEYLIKQRIYKRDKEIEPEYIIDSDKIISVLQGLNVLFIIDGYHDGNENSKYIMEEIFAKFGDQRIILTTLPEFCETAAILSRTYSVEYLSVEINGIDGCRLEEFTENFSKSIVVDESDYKNESEEFLTLIKNSTILKEYLKLPLTLALVIYLWRYDCDILKRVKCATSLYFQLFSLCQKKLVTCLHNHETNNNCVWDLMKCLGKQAWSSLQSQQSYGSFLSGYQIKEIEEMCENQKIDKKQFMSAFLLSEFDEDSSPDEYSYSFLNKTQMDFLAGAYLVDQVREKRSILRKISEWQKYHELIFFLTGHMARQKILDDNISIIFDLINEAEVDDKNFNFWWRILLESCHNKSLRRIISEDKLSQDHWELDQYQVVSGLKLLAHTPVELESLKIEIPGDVEPYDIPELLVTMQEMCCYRKKRNPTKVELHLVRHNEYSCDKLSDDFIGALLKWGRLTHFTGSLGEQEKNKETLVTGKCFKLKTASVRITTPRALSSLSNSLSNIYKSLKRLHIILAFSQNCDPKSLPKLKFSGDLEITVPNLKDEDKEWLAAVVQQVCGCPPGHRSNDPQQSLGGAIIKKKKN